MFVGVSFGRRFDVLRLRAADGTLVWQHTPFGQDGTLFSLAMIGEDLLLHGVVLEPSSGAFQSVVLRLSGATGVELWRDPGGIEPRVDGLGDVVDGHVSEDGIVVRKLAGATGLGLWQRQVSRTGLPNDALGAIGIDHEGNVLVGTTSLYKLNGITGDLIWHVSLPFGDIASVSRIDDRDDVVVQLDALAPEPNTDRALLKVDGGDGTELWRQDRAQTLIDVDHRGSVIVERARGRRVSSFLASGRASIVSLDGTSGEMTRAWRLGSFAVDAQAVGIDGDVLASVVDRAFQGRSAVARVLHLRRRGRPVAWTHSLGRVPGTDGLPPPRVAADAAGDLVVAWVRHRRATGYDVRVLTLSNANGHAR